MDARLFRWINDLADHTAWAHGLVSAYARYGIVLFAGLLVAAYLDARRRHDARGVAGAVWAAGAALVAVGIGQLIGHAEQRARPYDAMPAVHVLVARSGDFSFPSDHATAVGAIAAGLVITNRRWGVPALAAAIAMAAARVYVGVHYPGDVAVSLALGTAVAAAGTAMVVPLLTHVMRRGADTALRPILTSEARLPVRPGPNTSAPNTLRLADSITAAATRRRLAWIDAHRAGRPAPAGSRADPSRSEDPPAQ